MCHFANEGRKPLNVTGIMGSLNNNLNFGFYIQNYSYMPIGIVVKPGEEVSFEYQIKIDANLEPDEYRFAATVFYGTERAFSSTYFNETIELYYQDNDYDLKMIGGLVWGVVISIVGAGLVFYMCTADTRAPIQGVFKAENKKTVCGVS